MHAMFAGFVFEAGVAEERRASGSDQIGLLGRQCVTGYVGHSLSHLL